MPGREDIARDLAVACLNHAEIPAKLMTFVGSAHTENSKAKGKQIGEFYLGILEAIHPASSRPVTTHSNR